MTYKTWLLIVVVVLSATAASFFSHVYLQAWSSQWLADHSDYMRSLDILRPPYPTAVVVAAGVLQLLPISAEFVLCALAWMSLSFRQTLSKAVAIVILLLLAHDVVRSDIMTVIVGNPIGVALISRADSVVPKLLTALIFAIGLAIWNPTRANVLSSSPRS
jgi:hypothetical protein